MIRVLLVEDDPVIRDTTCYFLKSQQNFEVVCAETGGDALSHARERFDVILMDILLPDTNGVDLCQRLRSWHHCPIIFTSYNKIVVFIDRSPAECYNKFRMLWIGGTSPTAKTVFGRLQPQLLC